MSLNTSDSLLFALMAAAIAILDTYAIIDCMKRTQNINTITHLLHQQGFIQVKFHDTEIWIKPQDAQNLIQTDLESKNVQ